MSVSLKLFSQGVRQNQLSCCRTMSDLATTNNTALATQEQTSRFTPEQIDLIKRTVANGTTNDELKLFLYMASRTGLDPFARQLYAIKRKGKMVIQIGIDGYRVIADRTGRYAPGREPTFHYDNEGKLKSATAYVKKLVGGTWHEVAATAHWEEFYPGDGEIGFMWRRMPHTLLAKVAETQALRRAFPAELSGLYTNEEMAQADSDIAAPAEASPIENASQLKAIRELSPHPTHFIEHDSNQSLPLITKVTVSEPSQLVGDNSNRELLKRIGKITGHAIKEIATTLETNFPGLKSHQLGESEVKAMVDALCVEAAVKSGMNSIHARVAFNEWLGQQNQELGNEELARLWLNKIQVPAF